MIINFLTSVCTEIVKREHLSHRARNKLYIQRYNFIILENLNPTFINLSGYKKLNGSQIVKKYYIHFKYFKIVFGQNRVRKNYIYIYLILNLL